MEIRLDVWTQTEDAILQKAVMKYGSNQWHRVSSLLSKKSAAQCRSRWFEVLKPSISKSDFTKNEDILLIELAKRMPNMWRSISATLGNRSATQCHARYIELTENTTNFSDDVGGKSTLEEDEKEKKELEAEAAARLSNSMGRKAKRKQRERMEDEKKFNELLEQNKHIKTKKPLLQVPQIASNPELPDKGVPKPKRVNTHTHNNHRPQLKLPPPVNSVDEDYAQQTYNKLQYITLNREAVQKLQKILSKIPPPINN